jgi:hypothetical protein
MYKLRFTLSVSYTPSSLVYSFDGGKMEWFATGSRKSNGERDEYLYICTPRLLAMKLRGSRPSKEPSFSPAATRPPLAASR